ncbi:MAG: heavy metal-binding domain-containing protein [Saprospiraceae bacterium]|nr:heavy metal-binding domain-containing protein [Saprospiraceae bacterium]
MKNIFIAGCVLALSLAAFAACKHDHAKNAVAQAPAGKYICPMNCEKGKYYDQPGTCPVCNMDLALSKAEGPATQAEYFTAFSANPAQLEAGKAAMLSFTPKIKGNESAPVPLDLVHEKKMHLILVSDDLSWFDHIHPEYTATGSYDIKVLAKGENFSAGRGLNETRFENGGKFWAFADFKPTGGLNQVDKIELNVAGEPAKAIAYTREKLTASISGYELTMQTEGALTAGKHQHIGVAIKQNGKTLDPASFENYLGEKAHLVMVEVASKEFVHTHPAVENGKLQIHTTFAQPGTYRGWLQFQTAGKVHTADFVLQVGGDKAGHEGHNH